MDAKVENTIPAKTADVAFETLFEQGDIRIEATPGTSDRLVLSFTSLALKPSKWPRREFVNLTRFGGENHLVCVTDRGNSWFNAEGFDQIVQDVIEAYVAQHDIAKVSAVGVSMGGFNALQFSRLFPLDSVFALTPQFSVHPDIVPEEDRWTTDRNRISTWAYPKIEELPGDRTRFFVVHGDSEDETRHWQRYPVADNLCHVIVQGVGHKMSVLRKDGRLKWLVRSAVEADTERFLKVAGKAGAVTRGRYDNSQEI